jgi:hypothetical protein
VKSKNKANKLGMHACKIPALRSWGEEDHEFEASLGYMHNKTLSQKTKTK